MTYRHGNSIQTEDTILYEVILISDTSSHIIGTNLDVWNRWIIQGCSTACFHSATPFLILIEEDWYDVIGSWKSRSHGVLEKKRLYQFSATSLLIYILSIHLQEMLKRKRNRKSDIGFSFKFALFAGLIGIMVGFLLNLSLSSPST